MRIATSNVLRMCVVYTLGLQPVANLEVGDDQGTGSLGDADGISHVIPVTVSDHYVVRIDLIRRDGGKTATGDKGVDQDTMPANIDAERGMPIPS
jgi:hypothetical protein